MDPQEIKTLKLMEALESNGDQSQRDLSKKLEISLGLVNIILKKIVKKGLFKVTKADKTKLKYILTPKGMSEKSVLTYRFILYSIAHYADIRNKIKKMIDILEQRNLSTIVLAGAGEIAEIAYIVIKKTSLTVIGIVDDEKPPLSKFMEYTVNGTNFIKKQKYDAIIITDLKRGKSIKEELVRCGADESCIVELLES